MSRRTLLSDEQWARIAPLMSSFDGSRGRPFGDHRRVVEGIIYRYRPGDSVARFAGIVRVLADRVEAPLLVLRRWRLGQNLPATTRRSGRRRTNRGGSVGGFDGQPRPSARHEPGPRHRETCRVTRISTTSSLIMQLAGPAVV